MIRKTRFLNVSKRGFLMVIKLISMILVIFQFISFLVSYLQVLDDFPAFITVLKMNNLEQPLNLEDVTKNVHCVNDYTIINIEKDEFADTFSREINSALVEKILFELL